MSDWSRQRVTAVMTEAAIRCGELALFASTKGEAATLAWASIVFQTWEEPGIGADDLCAAIVILRGGERAAATRTSRLTT